MTVCCIIDWVHRSNRKVLVWLFDKSTFHDFYRTMKCSGPEGFYSSTIYCVPSTDLVVFKECYICWMTQLKRQTYNTAGLKRLVLNLFTRFAIIHSIVIEIQSVNSILEILSKSMKQKIHKFLMLCNLQ